MEIRLNTHSNIGRGRISHLAIFNFWVLYQYGLASKKLDLLFSVLKCARFIQFYRSCLHGRWDRANVGTAPNPSGTV